MVGNASVNGYSAIAGFDGNSLSTRALAFYPPMYVAAEAQADFYLASTTLMHVRLRILCS